VPVSAAVVLLVALAAPVLLVALALAVSAALPELRPRLHARLPHALREPADLADARAQLERGAPEWAEALRS